MSYGPVLCPMALSYVPSPCPLYHGPVLHPDPQRRANDWTDTQRIGHANPYGQVSAIAEQLAAAMEDVEEPSSASSMGPSDPWGASARWAMLGEMTRPRGKNFGHGFLRCNPKGPHIAHECLTFPESTSYLSRIHVVCLYVT